MLNVRFNRLSYDFWLVLQRTIKITQKFVFIIFYYV